MYERNMARLQFYIAVFLAVSKFSECARKRRAFEGFIVGGEYTTIDKFPHAVYLLIHCGDSMWMCGTSVVNQQILITAAHCLHRCTGKSIQNIQGFAGHEDIKQATSYKAVKFKNHENYSEEEFSYDLAMLAVEPLPLGDNIKRVVIPNHFPQNVQTASVAGWGLIVDQGTRVTTKKLKTVDQTMRDLETCENILGSMESGTFCAGEIDDHDHRPSMGDSGSGLIYGTRIQIGLVSYRVDNDPGLVVYTNVTYFYPWIEATAKTLYCQTKFLGDSKIP